MFCPECGTEDRQVNQFCRSCGADLGRVRTAAGSVDPVTASALAAREEIGRAVAAKICDIRSAEELSVVAEEVLPELEKFLESPAQKRLRRMRVGMLLATIGLGAAIGLTFASAIMKEDDIMFLAAMGLVACFLGIGFILNGLLFTVPRDTDERGTQAHSGRILQQLEGETSDLKLPDAPAAAHFTSVTESTTRHLKNEEEAVRKSDS